MGISKMERLSVKCSEFESNIRDYFRKLREEQIVFDVTLATDDGQQIQAHKIVLSAGSNFFRDIFTKSIHTNMLVYLKGINSKSLKHITQFIYNGEAYINYEEISEFLDAAKELKVIGIELEREVQDINHAESITDVIKEDMIKGSGEDLDESTNTTEKSEMVFDDDDMSDKSDVEQHTYPMIERNHEGQWECKVCCKKFKRDRWKMRRHEETHIRDVSYACKICSKTSQSRNALNVHIYNTHSKVVSCDRCDKSGMNRYQLNVHKKICFTDNK